MQHKYKLYQYQKPPIYFEELLDVHNFLTHNNLRLTSFNHFSIFCSICYKYIDMCDRNNRCIIHTYDFYDTILKKHIWLTKETTQHHWTSTTCILRSVETNEIISKIVLTRKCRRSWKSHYDQWRERYEFQQRFLEKRSGYKGWKYHRKIQYIRDYKQANVVVEEGYPNLIRGKRSIANLPNVWDDYNNQARNYTGWKNLKIRHQWMGKSKLSNN